MKTTTSFLKCIIFAHDLVQLQRRKQDTREFMRLFTIGRSENEILAAYPSLIKKDIRAALAYAAELSREHYVSLAAPGAADEAQIR